MVSLESLNVYHNAFEREVIQYMESLGIQVFPNGYERTINDPKLLSLLRDSTDINTMHIRGRSDWIAFTNGKCFDLEIKTRKYETDKPGATMEAMPLAIHIQLARLGEQCFYVYKDSFHPEREVGFWIDDHIIEKVSRIMLTSKYDKKTLEYCKKVFEKIYVGKPILQTKKLTNGSNDYFAVIEYEGLLRMPTWKSALDYRIRLL